MVIRAIAKVLKDVLGLYEWRLANPGQAFAAHMAMGHVAAVHVGCHVMASHPAMSTAALGNARRGIVRTAGAEIRPAHQ